MEGYESDMELSDSEPTVVETPSVETPSVEVEKPVDPTPETPAEILYETPDGRKVNAETLQKEWKENFLPEFTRKSQALAAIEREKEINNPKDDTPAWKKDGYVPESYAEVIQLAKEEAIRELKNDYQAEQERANAVKSAVESQLTEIKSIDPNLDENALFTHATKYGFNDLKAAHSNMLDMKKVMIDTEQRTVKNLKTRESDPISGNSGDMTSNDGYDPQKMAQFGSAAEMLESLNGKK